jgi:F-type H+-transporting ATPase subunit alpha
MVELLKQPQYQPLHMADQVMLIYAGSRGYLDKIPVNRIQEAKSVLVEFLRHEKSEVRNAIIQTSQLDEATEASLKKALDEFVVRWQETEAKKSA